MKLNWGVRFNPENMQFISRFIVAVFLPVLVYFGVTVEDLTTWPVVGELLVDAVKNPYVVGFTILNAVNVLFDPTTAGLSDSNLAMQYKKPKKDIQ